MQKYKVKTVNKKTIEVEGKWVEETKPPKPPLWFANWTVDFEKRINTRFDNIDIRLDKLDNRINNLVLLNNLKE